MKIAIVGSRTLLVSDIGKYIPDNIEEIVSGGAKGVDSCAREYAIKNNIKLIEFLPDYRRYGRWAAPRKRNIQIIEYVDEIIAFWDGKSNGTKFVIDTAETMGKRVNVILMSDQM